MAADVLQRRCPGLEVRGTYCPPFGFEHDVSQTRRIEHKLCDAQPDIIYVALGSPKQELFIERTRHLLPRAWWLGVGISFGFLSGQVRRAPKWMQQFGLEWLHRLVQEPTRLAKRYLLIGLPFAFLLLGGAARARIRHIAAQNH